MRIEKDCERCGCRFVKRGQNNKHCLDCTKALADLAKRNYRMNNLDKLTEIHRRYRNSERGKKTVAKKDAAQKERFPEKHAARIAVNNALKLGKLVKPDRCGCGAIGDIHGHHPDYSKPLDVVWLCGGCHVRLHKSLKQAAYGN